MNAERKTIVGFDAKRIVRNGTGLGAYGRTLVNALSALGDDLRLLLYAPDEGRKELTSQLTTARNVQWVYPVRARNALTKAWWRSKGIVEDLKRDGVCLFHGLSGELPQGIRKAGIPAIVTIHDLIFMRHPEYYHWWDAWIYTRKFRQTLKEAQRIIAISECTKRDIVELGRFPAERIEVIYQSCGTRFAVGPAVATSCPFRAQRGHHRGAEKHPLGRQGSAVTARGCAFGGGRTEHRLWRKGEKAGPAVGGGSSVALPSWRVQRRSARRLSVGRGLCLSLSLRRIRFAHHRSHTKRSAGGGLHGFVSGGSGRSALSIRGSGRRGRYGSRPASIAERCLRKRRTHREKPILCAEI